MPRPLWERELIWLKNIGITHVSLPPAAAAFQDAEARLDELIHILRRVNLEADLEMAVPERLQPQTREHGGPLTEPVSDQRISALAPGTLLQSRKLLTSGNPSFLWTDVEDAIGPMGYRAGAVNFAGVETPATTPLRRNAQLSRFWGQTLASLHELPGAGTRLPAPAVTAQQFLSDDGASFVAVVNNGSAPWTGDVKAIYPVLKRVLVLPNVMVPARDSLWLPVGVSFMAGSLCKACTGFATVDHLIYSTAELTDMEYENGILAMEFAAPSAGEVVMQVSKQPSGPLLAGGKPTAFDWDEAEKRIRLPIPAGVGAAAHVRIALVIDPPDQTAFFDSAHVLLIGETTPLTAEFSSELVAQRSRLRTSPEFHVTQEAAKEPLQIVYRIQIPANAIHGDHADLAFETDGVQMSHVRPELMLPVTLRFTDAVAVKVGADSTLTLSPAMVPVNQRTGRDIGISVRNNAPEIRNFMVEMKAEGLDFSPPRIAVSVGASASREVSFRVFAAGTTPGVHRGEVKISGAAKATELVRFAVIPQNGAVAYASDGIFLLESASRRASFLPARWLEFLNKENGQNAIGPGGMAFQAGMIEVRTDTLLFGGEKSYRLQDLEALAPKPRR